MGLEKEISETTLSAAQASIAVLLVLAYGLLSEKYNLLTHEGEKNISHLGVTLFLPALLFSEMGPQASLSQLAGYWIIIALAIWFQLLSFLVGSALRKLFHLPQWVVPCMIFNNATSLPLLLVNSLALHGALDDLVGKSESIDIITRRARNYILINALISNLTRFLLGPILMTSKFHVPHIFTHHETPHLPKPKVEAQVDDITRGGPEDSEYQPLLQRTTSAESPHSGRTRLVKPFVRRTWNHLKALLNPPLAGGIVAIIVGATPFLRWLFLSPDAPLAALTASIELLGNLYTALQVFVLGGQLYSKRGSKADLGAFALITVWRFVAMPFISISSIYFLRQKVSSGIFKSDPVLDFVLAILPVGPPAITLAAIADMSDLSSEEESCVDRTLMYSYVVTPLISMPVTAALMVVKNLYGI